MPVNWNDLEWDDAGIGTRRKVIHGQTFTLALVELTPDSVPTPHAHPHEQASTVQSGTGLFLIDGQPHPVAPGDVVLIPGNTPHALAVPGPDNITVLDLFIPRREEFPASRVRQASE